MAISLHSQESGAVGKPAVLFLHGFMGGASDWNAVVPALSANRRCVVVDLPGHGASVGLPDAAYSMDGVAAGLVRVLDARGVDRCTVVGYSMGGRAALYFAAQYPERCRRLILESASPGLATEAARATRQAADESRARRLETGDLEIFLNEWYRQPLFASLAEHDGLVERMVNTRRCNDPHELARVLRGLGTGRQPSLWERLPRWTVATLAVAGAHDAKYVALARRMAAASACVRAVVVPGAGHVVHAERLRRFVTLLRTFDQSS